jgi:hypothetical protein
MQAWREKRHVIGAASPAAPPSATDARVGELTKWLRDASERYFKAWGRDNINGGYFLECASALDALSARVGELTAQVDEAVGLLGACRPQIRPSTPAFHESGEIRFGHLVEKIDVFIASMTQPLTPERACHVCGKGGDGSPDETYMAYKQAFLVSDRKRLDAEIAGLRAEVQSEREARQKLDAALRGKDQAMDTLFKRLQAAGVDYEDLIP